MPESVRLTADRLRRLGSAILTSGGSAAPEADLVADHLVQANLAGHDSHGVGMIPAYVRHLQAGLVVPNTRAKVVKDDGAILMFDGLRGYGRCVAGEAMAAAIARCPAPTVSRRSCSTWPRARSRWARSGSRATRASRRRKARSSTRPGSRPATRA